MIKTLFNCHDFHVCNKRINENVNSAPPLPFVSAKCLKPTPSRRGRSVICQGGKTSALYFQEEQTEIGNHKLYRDERKKETKEKEEEEEGGKGREILSYNS